MFETMHMGGKGANIKILGFFFFFFKKHKTKKEEKKKTCLGGAK